MGASACHIRYMCRPLVIWGSEGHGGMERESRRKWGTICARGWRAAQIQRRSVSGRENPQIRLFLDRSLHVICCCCVAPARVQVAPAVSIGWLAHIRGGEVPSVVQMLVVAQTNAVELRVYVDAREMRESQFSLILGDLGGRAGWLREGGEGRGLTHGHPKGSPACGSTRQKVTQAGLGLATPL